MPPIQSTMLALGTVAPAFTLPELRGGATYSLSDVPRDHALLVVFLCAHCPYVQHIGPALASLGRDYHSAPLSIVAVSSNDAAAYPADSPENLRQAALQWGFSFPLCYDEDQQVARAYHAVCTPDFFLFDVRRQLVYRGRLDETRPDHGVADGKDLRKAIDALLAAQPIDPNQKPSIGCSIKWKADRPRE